MARSGNQRLSGSVRVVVSGGVPSFAPNTNSGLFDGIVDNGVGNFTLEITPDTPLSVGSRVEAQIEGTAAGAVVWTVPVGGLSIDVLTFDNQVAPAAADLAFGVRVWERLEV